MPTRIRKRKPGHCWPAVMLTTLSVVVSACTAASPVNRPALDAIAESYVRLQLAIGVHDKDHVAWYFGPPQWRTAAESRPQSLAQLRQTTERLLDELRMLELGELDHSALRRHAFLVAHLRAARYRLDMLNGAHTRFDDEAQALFGIVPELQPLESYDPVIRRIDALIAGAEPLSQRVEVFRKRYEIPTDRLGDVMRAAISECRRRTTGHMSLPPRDDFSLELVSKQGWSGNNVYLGDGRGIIQINTDFPVTMDRVVELACHEAYPGHHTHLSLLDTRLVKARGWVEYSIVPLYGPIAFILEGEASYAPYLAFSRAELARFETRTLYPLAGLDPAGAPALTAFSEAIVQLAGARLTIGRMFLDGELDRERALELIERYQLVSRAYAGQILGFMTRYRSYIINYGRGEPAVRAHVEAAGEDDEAKWKAMERLLIEPTLPADLKGAEPAE